MDLSPDNLNAKEKRDRSWGLRMMTRRDYKILDEINFDILEDDKMRKKYSII